MLRTIAVALLFLFATQARATEAGWALLRDGEHVVLLRHAMAPGAADPANFDIEKCSTQRKLSDRGKQQARKIGALFAARGLDPEHLSWDEIASLPCTPKAALREASDAFVRRGSRPVLRATTHGTTGADLRIEPMAG